MLKKYFFILPESTTKFALLLVVILMFSAKFLLLFLLGYGLLLFLFRKKKLDHSFLRNTDSTLILSPCEGRVSEIRDKGTKTKIEVKLSLFGRYGVTMPFAGEVRSYQESKKKIFEIKNFRLFSFFSKVELKSIELGAISLFFKESLFLGKARLWCRSGDKGLIGAYLGYLPFGGKIVIEIPNNLNILVKVGDKLSCAETLIAAKGKIDE